VQARSSLRETLGGNLRLEPRPIAAGQVRRHMVAWVDVWSAERFVRSVPVAMDVELFGERTGMPPLTRDPQQDPDRIGTTAARSSVVEVVRGEWAALRTTAGAVSLESRVEVLQDGKAGERVRVRQQGATGIVMARVIGRGQLELAP
jgi:flagella basal body P-ring formation protein FlgA